MIFRGVRVERLCHALDKKMFLPIQTSVPTHRPAALSQDGPLVFAFKKHLLELFIYERVEICGVYGGAPVSRPGALMTRPPDEPGLETGARVSSRISPRFPLLFCVEASVG
jgi:hypothetical protein